MKINKKIVTLFVVIVGIALFSGCQEKKEAQATNKPVQEEKKKEESKKKETKLTNGELFDKINAISPIKEVTIIEDTEIGFKNLNISLNINKGTAIEELESYTKNVVKVQNGLKDYFSSNKYLYVTYGMYIEGEFKSVTTSYKRQENNYKLENTTIIDEKYKKAASALN